ncbi:phytanoyl-CoA dioxygenase family protein [Solwaraspora sp. WMMA2056]|uniref:phytanoyl-CoA dioxygenase family protein n=1 Tax=Solwaraspora sp. WMMA2056 TaxID=3015161 RepID=UPI00259BE50B|nr:phytanoyl-CoA dioxygenase family protein [Solwaraspora sp. WMMA2056]WJK41313.1 phytanoyl-CoA dioxygenase family protein [Solwaraspora sp. WMMA2056]
MKLTKEQLATYHNDGYLLLNDVFSSDETETVCIALSEDQRVPGPHRITEDDGVTLRSIYASHARHPVFARLVRSERLLGPAQQIAGEDLYVHQMKINSKQAFGGERWAWHQDYIVWRDVDNMPAPSQVNVAIFLDDVTEFNGPVIFLRGSHRLGTLERPGSTEGHESGHIDPDEYSLTPAELADLVKQHEMVSPKGTRGGVLLFSSQIVHGSGTNISPFARRLLILTYNPVSDAPRPVGAPRAEHLAGRDATPLVVDRGPLDRH